MTAQEDPRYQIRYKNGYYLVVDTHNGEKVVPCPKNHYKRYRDGYLWINAAQSMAAQYNREGVTA